MRVQVNCPYCGNSNYMKADVSENGFTCRTTEMILCDTDDSNGCDKYFVAVVKTKVEATCQALKYDDEPPQEASND